MQSRSAVPTRGACRYDQVFMIRVTDVNLAPTDVVLSKSSVDEEQPAGTVVGTGTVTADPEPPAAPFLYTFVSGTGSADNASFTIAGDQLKTAAQFDYETNSYSIRVRSADAGGLSCEKELVISVNRVPHAAAEAGNNQVANEGDLVRLQGSFTDPDVGDTHTFLWHVVASNGQSIPDGTEQDFSFTATDQRDLHHGNLPGNRQSRGLRHRHGYRDRQQRPTDGLPALRHPRHNRRRRQPSPASSPTPGTADTFTLTIDWGQGETPDTIAIAAGQRSFTKTHTYADDNPVATSSDNYSIKANLTDDDGGAGPSATDDRHRAKRGPNRQHWRRPDAVSRPDAERLARR